MEHSIQWSADVPLEPLTITHGISQGSMSASLLFRRRIINGQPSSYQCFKCIQFDDSALSSSMTNTSPEFLATTINADINEEIQ